jgi:hypothetical protein
MFSPLVKYLNAWGILFFMDSADKTSEVIETIPFSLILWKKMHNTFFCVHVNATAEKLLGIDRTLWVGKEIKECYPHVTSEDIKGLHKVMKTGRVWRQGRYDYQGNTQGKQFDIKFTAFKIDQETVGVLTEHLHACTKINLDGTPCENTSSVGDYCMTHAMVEMRRQE